MNYAELITEIYVQTGRPDLVAETAAALRSATLAAHSSNDYDLDEATILVVGNGVDTLWNISLADIADNDIYRLVTQGGQYNIVVVGGTGTTSTAPPVRKILNVWTCTGTGILQQELQRKTPAEIFDSYGLMHTDVWRQVGKSLSIKTCTPPEAVTIAYLAMPDTSAGGYNSWIAEAAPYYLVHMAASNLLGPVVGKMDEASAQRQLAQAHLAQLYEHIRT